MKLKNKEITDLGRFILGSALLIAGVVMLFIAMYMDPAGQIHESIIATFGEISVIAGCILGLDAYVDFKMKKIVRKNENKEEQ